MKKITIIFLLLFVLTSCFGKDKDENIEEQNYSEYSENIQAGGLGVPAKGQTISR